MSLLPEFSHLRGRILYNASLADYNSWQVGGAADILYHPADLSDLTLFLTQLPPTFPVLWLGLGSNVLIRDGGVEGVVIITQGGLQAISPLAENQLRVEAGVSCAKIARASARLGLTGLEFMAGIPGTVGGALAMNAGCYGGETWEHVLNVETLDRQGNHRIRPPTDFSINYRHVIMPPDEWFIAAQFQLKVGDKEHALQAIRVLLEKRNAAQPTGLPNCGSTFKNALSHSAGYLIEQCGLKGLRIGGAYVSEKHANFLINDGKASAADIENLIKCISDKVYAQEGVRLVPEVCIIGRSMSG